MNFDLLSTSPWFWSLNVDPQKFSVHDPELSWDTTAQIVETRFWHNLNLSLITFSLGHHLTRIIENNQGRGIHWVYITIVVAMALVRVWKVLSTTS